VSPHSEYCRTSDGVIIKSMCAPGAPLRQVGAVGVGEGDRDDTVRGHVATPDHQVEFDLPVGRPPADRLFGRRHDIRRTGIDLYW